MQRFMRASAADADARFDGALQIPISGLNVLAWRLIGGF